MTRNRIIIDHYDQTRREYDREKLAGKIGLAIGCACAAAPLILLIYTYVNL